MCLSLQQHIVCLLLLIFLWSLVVALVVVQPILVVRVVVLAVCAAQSRLRVAVAV
jgi:hypothetical protein